MILNIIVGNNIDTPTWISKLKNQGADFIVVLDYENDNDPVIINSIPYLSIRDTKSYMKNFTTINFSKSIYGYPGRTGDIFKINNKNNNNL